MDNAFHGVIQNPKASDLLALATYVIAPTFRVYVISIPSVTFR